jgi:hypothetical protein
MIMRCMVYRWPRCEKQLPIVAFRPFGKGAGRMKFPTNGSAEVKPRRTMLAVTLLREQQGKDRAQKRT